MNNDLQEKIRKQEELEQLKSDLFGKLNVSIENDFEGPIIEVKEESNEIDIQKNNELSDINNKEIPISKEHLNKTLIRLQNTTEEVLDHLVDIVTSSLPDNRTIAETSSIINQIVNINKQLYEMNHKNKDEVDKEAAKELNSKMIKDLIDQIHNKESQ